MAGLWNFFASANDLIPEYPRWVFWLVVVVVIGLSQLSKIQIKHFTDKIPNDALRKKINAVIMLLPIAIGFAASGVLVLCGFAFSWEAALVCGGVSQVIYGLVERLVRRVKKGEEITDETISEDLKDSVKEAETAEDKFNELVGKIKKGE